MLGKKGMASRSGMFKGLEGPERQSGTSPVSRPATAADDKMTADRQAFQDSGAANSGGKELALSDAPLHKDPKTRSGLRRWVSSQVKAARNSVCIVLITTVILTVLVVVVHQLGWIATHTSEKLERL